MNLYLLISNLLMIGTFAYKFNKLPPQIPLFYSKLAGEDQLVDLWMIIIIPILMNGFIFLNNYIARQFFPEDSFIRKMLYYANLFILISFTLIFIRIIFLVS